MHQHVPSDTIHGRKQLNGAVWPTYVAGAGTVEQQIKRDGGGGVDEKPRLDVVDSDLTRVGDDLAVV